MRGDLTSGRASAARAVAACDGPDDPAYLHAIEVTGDVAAFEGRLGDAETAFEAEAHAATQQGDPDAASMGWSGVAITRAYQGRSDEAVDAAELAVHAGQDAGPASLAFAVYATGECLADTDPTRAIERTERAVELARACDAWFVEGVARLTVTSLRARHGDAAAALPAFDELLRHWERSGSWTQQWTTLRNLAELLVRLGADEAAVMVASAAEERPTANQLFGTESERLAEALATAARRLGEDAYAEARRRGRELEPAEVLGLAHATIASVRG
jgi:tetratricopeptide (TPR) repeat protein